MSVAACIMMVPALMVPDNRASPYVEDAGLSDCDTFVTTIPCQASRKESCNIVSSVTRVRDSGRAWDELH